MIEVRPSRPGWTLVTFRHAGVGRSITVLGDFNGWNPTAHRLALDADGEASIEVEIPSGHRYRFRYLVDGERWENDWAADAYDPNEFGGSDSVLDLREELW